RLPRAAPCRSPARQAFRARRRDLFGSTARLAAAVEAYRDALQELTRARSPLEWATTQNNLGTALKDLGTRESGTARLEEAVEAHQEATQELTRARVPVQWAVTQHNLAVVYRALFEKDREPRHLDDAILAIDGALEQFRTANKSRLIQMAEPLREKILAAKGEL
ncbi:MAG: hypothetical protein DLM68_13070, partial [Hyphomicrobiales bacterium]